MKSSHDLAAQFREGTVDLLCDFLSDLGSPRFSGIICNHNHRQLTYLKMIQDDSVEDDWAKDSVIAGAGCPRPCRGVREQSDGLGLVMVLVVPRPSMLPVLNQHLQAKAEDFLREDGGKRSKSPLWTVERID